MKQLHDAQLQILKRLLFAKQLRYSELKPDAEMENNQFDFHLDKLISQDYIRKDVKYYLLTNKGKEYANRMDTDEVVVSLQSKLSAWICCTRQKDHQKQYLIYTRLKQPFYGCQGFMSGKVRYGEKILETAKRELKEETNLEGDPKIVTIRHYLVYDKITHKLVEDKFMFLCLIQQPTGQLVTNNEGKYEWVNEKDLKKYVINHFESFAAFKQQIQEIKSFDGNVKLQEINHESEKF